MSTSAELVREIRSLGIRLSEIDIPPRWYQEIILNAKETIEGEEEDY